MVKKIIILLLSVIYISSCSKVYNKKNFFIENNKIDKNFVMNGYFYNVYERNDKITKYSGKGIKMKIFLSNGLFYNVKNGYGNLCGMNVDINCEIEQSEVLLRKYLNSVENSKKKNSKVDIWNWGNYSIINDSIKIKWFYNRFGDYYLKEEIGILIDSNTFILKKVKDYRTNIVSEINEKYIFKEYDIKNIYKKAPDFNSITNH